MLDAAEARRTRRRLDFLMKQIDELYQEILERERKCPAPTLGEFKEMDSGARPYRYEVFFLGLVGEIGDCLNEAIKALWKGYRSRNVQEELRRGRGRSGLGHGKEQGEDRALPVSVAVRQHRAAMELDEPLD